MKRQKSIQNFKRRRIIFLSVILVLAVLVNVGFRIFSSFADLYLGRGEVRIDQAEGTENWDSAYYRSDYSDEETLAAAAYQLVEDVEAEGIVLLKNNGVLPLATSAGDKAKVTILGRDAADSVFGGSGSGSVKLDTAVTFKGAMETANFAINETVFSLLADYASFSTGLNQFGGPKRIYDHPKADIIMDKPEESVYDIGEMPVNLYTDKGIASFDAYNDAAIIMFGRGGGEGGDLARDMKGSDDHYVEGQHQLELNKDERDLLELAKGHFEKVIVLINSSSAMELGILEEDDQIDAVLWIGSPGQSGFGAVSKVLNGSINPSGRTADLYAADFTADPTFVNFGHYQYANMDETNAIGKGYFVQYEEGLYYGYRYYETAGIEGFIDYDKAVVYPFGYGLSYTDFDWALVGETLGDTDERIAVDVKVTNTGDSAGQDVVQLYYAPPYYKGGIEKSAVVLGDFAKTRELKPGESQVLTLSLAVEDMASYDYKKEKAYVLDAGVYGIRLQRNSHVLKEGLDEIPYTVEDTIVYKEGAHRASDRTMVSNRFEDVSSHFSDTPEPGKIVNFSRSDFAGTFPTAPDKDDFNASDDIIAAFQAYVASEHLDENALMPLTGQDNGISLIRMRGLDFDDDLWDIFLDQIDPKDMAAIVNNSAYHTAAIESIGKPATVDLDGPAGITSFMGGGVSGTSLPSAVVIASTFNTELAGKIGNMIGNECLMKGVNGWYAPAVNLHRSPFAGRNFEYYSEDPVLSGKIGTAVVSAAAEKGVYSFIKHFALNDQESNRVNNGVSTWANEQTIREIYLKPFEIIVKKAEAPIQYIADKEGTIAERNRMATTAVMSSFNRIGGTWAGGSYALLQKVLREEWGFKGVVISDFNLYPYMYINQGLMAGTDFNISFAASKGNIEDTTSPTAVSLLRRAAHRLMYTVANSNAMNGIVPGTVISYTMAPWMKGLILGDLIVLILLAAGIMHLMFRLRKSEKK